MVIYALSYPWMVIKPTAYHGFMLLVLRSKIEGIYTFKAHTLTKMW